MNLPKDEDKMLADMVPILCEELPEMEPTHIINKVYDPDYFNLVLYKEGRPIGGLVFCIFPKDNFAELSLCAVVADQKGKGFGAMLVNHMKDYLVSRKIGHVITCADQSTPNFYRRVGFTCHLTLNNERMRKVEICNNIVLMQCDLVPSVSYVRSKEVITKQIEHVDNLTKANKFSVRLPGFSFSQQLPRQLPLNRVAILEKLGFKQPVFADEWESLYPKLSLIIEAMIKTPWVYLFVGDRNSKPPGYWSVIDPTKYTDLSTIQGKLFRKYYTNLHLFKCDFNWMIICVKDFYDKESPPYKHAELMEQFVNEQLIKYGLVDAQD